MFRMIAILDEREKSDRIAISEMETSQFFLLGTQLYQKTDKGFISTNNGHHQAFSQVSGVPVKVEIHILPD